MLRMVQGRRSNAPPLRWRACDNPPDRHGTRKKDVSAGTSQMPRALPWWTWLAPLVICHIGTLLSLKFQFAPGTAILYLPIGRAGGWCCRSCLRLRYLSTVESERLRNIGQLGKLYARLGGAEWLHGPLPDKPRGMHLETYERILAAIDARKRAHIEIVTSRLRHKV